MSKHESYAQVLSKSGGGVEGQLSLSTLLGVVAPLLQQFILEGKASEDSGHEIKQVYCAMHSQHKSACELLSLRNHESISIKPTLQYRHFRFPQPEHQKLASVILSTEASWQVMTSQSHHAAVLKFATSARTQMLS